MKWWNKKIQGVLSGRMCENMKLPEQRGCVPEFHGHPVLKSLKGRFMQQPAHTCGWPFQELAWNSWQTFPLNNCQHLPIAPLTSAPTVDCVSETRDDWKLKTCTWHPQKLLFNSELCIQYKAPKKTKQSAPEAEVSPVKPSWIIRQKTLLKQDSSVYYCSHPAAAPELLPLDWAARQPPAGYWNLASETKFYFKQHQVAQKSTQNLSIRGQKAQSKTGTP